MNKRFDLSVNNEYVWLDNLWLDKGCPDSEHYRKKIESLRNNDDFPTAWICVNDSTAISYVHALTELGMKIPDDQSIIGFDNISEIFYPGLTTIDVQKQYMGQKSIEQLIFRIQNPDAPYVNILLNVQLIKRNSVKQL